MPSITIPQRIIEQRTRLIALVTAHWWYLFALVYVIVAWLNPMLARREGWFSRSVEVVIILVCVARFCVPTLYDSRSTLARGWLVLAMQWLLLAIYRAFGYSLTNVTGISQIILPLAIYLPMIAFIVGCFVVLPFGQRQRLSVVLDWLVMSMALTVLATVVLQLLVPEVTWLDGLYIGADISTIYAMVLIRDQQPLRWARLFSAVSVGIAAITCVDVLWVLFHTHPSIHVPFGALYALAWLIFSRAALIIPVPIHNTLDISRLQLEHWVRHSIPYMLLLLGLTLVLWLNERRLAVLLLTLLLVRIMVEIAESRALSQRLEQSRQAEHLARADAEYLRELLRSSIHDLRSPIDGASGIVTLLQYQPDTPQRGRLINALQTQVNDISDHMHDLLDLARAQTQQLSLDQPCELAQIIRDTVAHLPHHNAIITLDLAPTSIISNERLISRIITNLLKNALEHGGDQISIKLTSDATAATITIHDNGAGFPTTMLEHGIQAGWSNRTHGYGFGLAGVLANIAVLNGTITLENRDGAVINIVFRR